MLAEMGLSEDDFPDEVIEVWPQTLDALELFAHMATQWRGDGGGLDYGVVRQVMRWIGITGAERQRSAFEGLRVFEQEALERMAKQAKKAAQRRGK